MIISLIGSLALILVILGLNLLVRSQQILDDQENMNKLANIILKLAYILFPLGCVLIGVGIAIISIGQTYITVGASLIALAINFFILGFFIKEPKSKHNIGVTAKILAYVFTLVGCIALGILIAWVIPIVQQVLSELGK